MDPIAMMTRSQQLAVFAAAVRDGLADLERRLVLLKRALRQAEQESRELAAGQPAAEPIVPNLRRLTSMDNKSMNR